MKYSVFIILFITNLSFGQRGNEIVKCILTIQKAGREMSASWWKAEEKCFADKVNEFIRNQRIPNKKLNQSLLHHKLLLRQIVHLKQEVEALRIEEYKIDSLPNKNKIKKLSTEQLKQELGEIVSPSGNSSDIRALGALGKLIKSSILVEASHKAAADSAMLANFHAIVSPVNKNVINSVEAIRIANTLTAKQSLDIFLHESFQKLEENQAYLLSRFYKAYMKN